MLVFAILGALDRLFGNHFGIGKEFERGFMLLGNMALSMIGILVLSPLIAEWLAPCFQWFYNTFGIDPAMIPAVLFANDLGGASLSKAVAQNEELGMFFAMIVSAMMGCTISFTVPYALGIVEKKHHKDMFFGFLCGIVTIPTGCVFAGVMLHLPLGTLLINLLPLLLLSTVIALGLKFAPQFTVKAFAAVGGFIKVIITIGLSLGMVEYITGYTVLEGLGGLQESASICVNAAVVLSGAFPFMYVVSKLLAKPLQKIGDILTINDTSAMGFIASVVTSTTTFEMMNRMDRKGIILNAAFSVSAAFALGTHLAFTMAFDSSYIPAMIVAKLISGVFAVVAAGLLIGRDGN